MAVSVGKPHPIKEENYLLFGVVEEKALASYSLSSVISFDYWTIRKDVTHDRRTGAACTLQHVWRTFAEKRRKSIKREARRSRLAAQSIRETMREFSASLARSPEPVQSLMMMCPGANDEFAPATSLDMLADTELESDEHASAVHVADKTGATLQRGSEGYDDSAVTFSINQSGANGASETQQASEGAGGGTDSSVIEPARTSSASGKSKKKSAVKGAKSSVKKSARKTSD